MARTVHPQRINVQETVGKTVARVERGEVLTEAGMEPTIIFIFADDTSCEIVYKWRLSTKVSHLEFDKIQVLVKEGDVYEFEYDVTTRAGHIHPKGSSLYVHDRTDEIPFGELGPNGYNWMCRTDFGISVWSTLESCIERGLLKKKT